MKVKRIERIDQVPLQCDITTSTENFFVYPQGEIGLLAHNSPMIAMANSFPGVDGPFVGMKNIFAKVPQLFQTDEAIEEKYGHIPDLSTKLKTALAFADKLGIPDGEIWKGDFLFTKEDIKLRSDEGKEFVTFRPNTIVYAIEKGSELGERVLQSDIGIVFHTIHRGETVKDSESGVSYDVNVSSLDVPDNAFILDANLPSLAGTVFLTEDETQMVDEKLSAAKSLFKKVQSKYPDILNPNSVQQGLLNKFSNQAVRISDKDDQFFGDPSVYVEKFIEWFSKKYEDESLTKKTDRGRESTIKRKEALIAYFQNDEGFFNLISIQQIVVHLKKLFVSKLEALGDMTPYTELPDGSIKITNHEGFAVSDIDGNIVKFVDRLVFSKANLLGHGMKESRLTNAQRRQVDLLFQEAPAKLRKGEVKGEDYEVAIVAGWYINQGMLPQEILRISEDLGVASHKMEKILSMGSVMQTGQNIAEKIKAPLGLTGREQGEVYGRTIQALTPEWKQHGASNATPKTDILIGDARISLKMGPAQLMSGGRDETLATFHAALEKTPGLKSSPEVQEVLSLVEQFVTSSRAPGKLRQVIKDGQDPVVTEGDRVNKEAMASFRTLFSNSPEFKIAFVREAMSGEAKFGSESPAAAEWMLAADFEGDQVGVHSIFDDAYCSKIGDQAKVSIRFKSSSVKKSIDGVSTKTGEYNFWSVVGLLANALKESKFKEGFIAKLSNFFKKKLSSILDFFGAEPEVTIEDEINFNV